MSPSPRNVRLLLAYEGTRYAGFQLQPNGVTIQAKLEEAFERMTGHAVRVRVASRTDAGVHAAGQVVLLPNPSRHEPAVIQRALNALLPDDIVVREASWAPEGFDPRRDASGKHYRYVIHQGHVPPLFGRALCWHHRGALDLEAMNRASALLLGEHDFSAFRGSRCDARSSVRTLDRIAWRRRGPLVALDIFGRAFLKQMVRNIVGTAVEIGRGLHPSEQMGALLQGRDRTAAGQTAPACGLSLRAIFYTREEYLAAIARDEVQRMDLSDLP